MTLDADAHHRSPPARRWCRRASTTSTPRSRATSACPRSPAAPTSSPASCSAIRPGRSGAARSRRAGSGMQVEVWDDSGKPVRRREGRAGLHRALPLHAGRILERPRRAEIPRRLFRALPQRLVPRRLRRAHRARRPDHLRPLRRDAQSRRRAHRHGRDLPPGRAAARGGREHRHRPGLARRRAGRAVRAAAARARRWTRR